MKDFTPDIYKLLIEILSSNSYHIQTFEEFLTGIKNNFKKVILRHDIDRVPQNSLKIAHLENTLGVKGTYYFRVVPESYDLRIMNQIAELGHEIGYHYEDVDLVVRNQKAEIRRQKKEDRIQKAERRKQNETMDRDSLIDLAYESFCQNLELFRANFDIKTICMHGSPLSKYDNRIIWEKYNYKDLGIIGEPYYDLDFNEFAYFTDTGRRWNGNNVSVRDKVESEKYAVLNRQFKSTQEIIDNIARLPSRAMFTFHPQRWTNDPVLWTKELVVQNVKNVVKAILVKTQNSKYGKQ